MQDILLKIEEIFVKQQKEKPQKIFPFGKPFAAGSVYSYLS